MKIVKVIGGLGNQMFQYAFFIALSKRFLDEDILVDCSFFDSYGLHNGLELESVFDIKLPKASKRQLLQVRWPVKNYNMYRVIRKFFPNRKTVYIEVEEFVFDKFVFEQKGDIYFDGYWQNHLYFNDISKIISTSFIFKNILDERNEDLLRYIKNEKSSISIHVRRGDYLKSNLYKGLCDLDYYRNAIKYIINKLDNPVFFVFSNDIDWCKDNLMDLLNAFPTTFVSWNDGKNSYIDMQLMSCCKCNIIANSSFSWWAAWLNSFCDKIVIAPTKWINRSKSENIIPDEWIRL